LVIVYTAFVEIVLAPVSGVSGTSAVAAVGLIGVDAFTVMEAAAVVVATAFVDICLAVKICPPIYAFAFVAFFQTTVGGARVDAFSCVFACARIPVIVSYGVALVYILFAIGSSPETSAFALVTDQQVIFKVICRVDASPAVLTSFTSVVQWQSALVNIYAYWLK